VTPTLPLLDPGKERWLGWLASIARAFDWDESKKTMEEKYADALPPARAAP
jgi:hypothetical protein